MAQRVRSHQVLMIIGMALYVLSLGLPAIVTVGHDLLGRNEHTQTMYGYQCLVSGWIVFPGWVANPLVIIGAPLLSVGIRRAAIVLFILALISAVIAPFLLLGLDFARLEHIHVGYVAWLASIVTLLVASITAPVSVKAFSPSRIPLR